MKEKQFCTSWNVHLFYLFIFLQLELNQLKALMLMEWKQFSECVYTHPLANTLQPIASSASWVLSNPVDFAKRNKPPSGLHCLTVSFVFQPEKKYLCLSTLSLGGHCLTRIKSTHAHPFTVGSVSPEVSWGAHQHPSVWDFFFCFPQTAARHDHPGFRLICLMLVNQDSESESPATVLLHPFVKLGSRVWWIVGLKPMWSFCSLRPDLLAPGCLAPWSLSKGLFVYK